MPYSDLDLLLLIDDDVIAELRDILQEEFGDLVRDFVDDVPIQLELMQTALDQGNADGLYRLAHKLKSSCGSLGAPRLAELVRQLEQAGRQATLDGAATLLAQAQATADDTVAGLRVILQAAPPGDRAGQD